MRHAHEWNQFSTVEGNQRAAHEREPWEAFEKYTPLVMSHDTLPVSADLQYLGPEPSDGHCMGHSGQMLSDRENCLLTLNVATFVT